MGTPPKQPSAWGQPAAAADGFEVWLRSAPPRLAGGDSAAFIHGAVAHRHLQVATIELTAGGPPVAPLRWAMPSPTLAAERPDLRGADRAIFWGAVPLRAGSDSVAITVTAGASEATLRLAAVDRTPSPVVLERPVGPRTVVICMATYEPPPVLFERQVESLRAQSHADWLCVISDDASPARGRELIRRVIGDDDRFVIAEHDARVGAYANFGRVLAMVPGDAGFVAPCDQDDVWHPDKLARLLAALDGSDARLAFADMRVTDADGSVLHDTYWTKRRPNHANFASLLLGNSVTGAASLFRRELLEDALPLPPRFGNLYHDHWLALVAAATGRIEYVDRPLHDYVQHEAAVIGHAGANRGVVGGNLVQRLAALRGRAPGRLRGEWRRIYFGEYCRMVLTAAALQRFDPSMTASQRRALRLAATADSSPLALAWLAGRQVRRLRRDDTGGSEAGMLRALAWSRALRRGRHDPLDDADLPPEMLGTPC
jgi:glycosyltransferase involved in cell wall biosynthesis